jgi:hypothetical protein
LVLVVTLKGLHCLQTYCILLEVLTFSVCHLKTQLTTLLFITALVMTL